MRKNLKIIRNIFLAGFTPVVMIFAGCATIPDDAPTVFHEAEEAIDVANSQDVDDTFPATMKTAEDNFDKALSLYQESQSKDAEDSDKADVMASDAVADAKKARDLARGATKLHNNIKVWDKDLFTLEGYYSIPDLLSEVKTLKGKLTAAEQSELKSPFAKFKDQRFQGTVAFFDTDKAMLEQHYVPAIIELASLVKTDDVFVVTVSGFADSRGSATFNEYLAKKRAEAVATVLEKNGVPKDRIKIAGLGSRFARYKKGVNKLQLERRADVTVAIASH